VHAEFRASERDVTPRWTCWECGKQAQGNVRCEDGELCDACASADAIAWLESLRANLRNATELFFACADTAAQLAGIYPSYEYSTREARLLYETLRAFSNLRLLRAEFLAAKALYHAARHEELPTTRDPAVRHWLAVNS
jgi:hypothetical protein